MRARACLKDFIMTAAASSQPARRSRACLDRSWDETELNRAFEHSRRIGYELIELPRFDPSMISVDTLRRMLDAHDLKCAITMGLAWDADISNPDRDIAKRGETMLENAVSAARDIGVELLGGILYSTLGKYPKAPTPQKAMAMRWMPWDALPRRRRPQAFRWRWKSSIAMSRTCSTPPIRA
jgi:sugar phosphate isomerase/epimerase